VVSVSQDGSCQESELPAARAALRYRARIQGTSPWPLLIMLGRGRPMKSSTGRAWPWHVAWSLSALVRAWQSLANAHLDNHTYLGIALQAW
jgi:hypothetical protein